MPSKDTWHEGLEEEKRRLDTELYLKRQDMAKHGGKSVDFSVGVIICEQHEKLKGKIIAAFVKQHFPTIFRESNNPDGNIFLQDRDPSQNSNAAKAELETMGGVQFNIPPRSPDCNTVKKWWERREFLHIRE